jgi:hypothetical protein
MTTERYFADATIEELKAAAEACRKAAAIDDAEWDGDHADEARRLTDALGWAWDFTSWSDAASILEREAGPEMTTTYKVNMRDDGGSRETVEIEADDLDEAKEQAESEVRDWVRGGDWGDEGATVRVYWTILDEDDDEVYEDATVVDVAPDYDALIRAAGGDPDCEHEWTSEGEGGCTENPGVWSHGGTTISVSDHCRLCGLHRCKLHRGSQRNPGEHDEVEYRQPESWCPECENEECRCE